MSLAPPALLVKFFTTSTAWEAQEENYNHIFIIIVLKSACDFLGVKEKFREFANSLKLANKAVQTHE